MANRKAKPIEGEVCWFCKQPADHESWMGLGFLKSTSQPVFEGNYILYHEPCAVYSNGAGDVPADGMDDQTVLKFWLHGEKCSGIGLKCQLCGLKGATTGCLHGPCQQFYHYPCARVRAAQGHLQFSLQCRALACSTHLDMLPLPVEEQFLGMWMEGGGSWNGSLVGPAASSWLPHYEAYLAAFKARWQHLLTMTPAEELRAAAAAAQPKGKAKRRSKTGARGSNPDRDDSDPEFRVKKSGRGSHHGGKSRASQSQLARGTSMSLDGTAQQQQQQQQRKPHKVGVPPEIAQAAARQAGQPDAVPLKTEPLADIQGAAAAAAAADAQQWPELDCGLLLQAAGFGAPVPGAAAQPGGAAPLSQQALQAVAAAAVAAVGGATSSRTASGVARGGGAGGAAVSSVLQGGASSADSAPASGGSRRRAAGRAAAAREAAEADTAAAPAEAGASPQQQQQQQGGAASEQLSLELPDRVRDALLAPAGKDSGLGTFPIRRAAPAVLRQQQPKAGAAAAAAAAPAAGAAAAESSEGGMSFSGGMFLGPAGADESKAQQGTPGQPAGRNKRKYLDVNTYMQSGKKVLTKEASTPAAAAAGAGGAADGPQRTSSKQQRTSRSQISDCPSTGSWSRTLHSTSPGGLSGGLLGMPPLAAAGNGSAACITPPEGWPGSYRGGTDMFSWLQQQVQRQQLQPGKGHSPVSGSGVPLQGSPAAAGALPQQQQQQQQQQQGLGLDLSAAGFDSKQGGGSDAADRQALQALAQAIQQHVVQVPAQSSAAAAAAASTLEPQGGVDKAVSDAGATAAAAVAAAAAAAGLSEQERDKLVNAVRGAAQEVMLSGGNGSAVAGGGRSTGNGNGIARAAAAAAAAAAPALHSAARESSTQVPLLLRQPGSVPALHSPKAAAAGTMGPPSPQASLAAAVAAAAAAAAAAPAASGISLIKQQLQQLLLQQQRGDTEQPRSPGSAKSAAMLSGIADVLRQAMEQPGASRRPGAAGSGSSSRQAQPDSAAASLLMNQLAEVLKNVDKLGAASPRAAAPGRNAAAAAAAARPAAAAAAAPVLPRMVEYFGCVTSVPPLSPGEVRAAGVTAHPNVVSTFLRQRDGTPLQALQPWSIVVPPSSQQQLAAVRVQPSHISSQLHSLLQASNVLNNHTTSTAASGSAAAAAALLPAPQGGKLSGGYAGMPQDLPVRYVRGGFVGPEDPRRHLQGEFTLTALQDLDPGTVLGPWRSYVLGQEDYNALMNAPPADWQPPPGQARDTAWLELLHKYTLTLRVPTLEGPDPFSTACTRTQHTLYFCALGHGNLTCLANDPLLDPLAASLAAAAAAAASSSSAWEDADQPRIGPPNVSVVVVLANGLPLPLLVATRGIKAGEQVCYSYGAGYWHAWAGLRAQIMKEQHQQQQAGGGVGGGAPPGTAGGR